MMVIPIGRALCFAGKRRLPTDNKRGRQRQPAPPLTVHPAALVNRKSHPSASADYLPTAFMSCRLVAVVCRPTGGGVGLYPTGGDGSKSEP